MQPHHAEQQSFALSNSNHSEGWNFMVTLSMVLQSSFAYIADKLQREDGQDFAEYAIILALVVLAAATAFTTLGTNISTAVTAVGTAVANAVP
jgi:Flp pilus assembly pilin Flp